MSKQAHYWLYVLRLEQGKYYVGITTQTPEARFNQHKTGFAGAAWTRLHKPVALIDTRFLGDLDEEDAKLYEARVTRKYIKRYGLKNVRGGDLMRTQPYILRLGRYYLQDDWRSIWTVAFLLFVIAYLLFREYI